jgi:hypothetical protein
VNSGGTGDSFMTKVGVLAEDNSDVEVVHELIKKFKSPQSFCIRRFTADGCGKLKYKCRAWSQQLFLKGCTVLLLLHDLDKKNLKELRRDLSASLTPCPISKHVIIIPIEEIEAWLLSDPKALKDAFSFKSMPKLSGNPEKIISPKEKLESLVWRLFGKKKRYLNTVHNAVIAKHASIQSLRKCSAFHAFECFIRKELN